MAQPGRFKTFKSQDLSDEPLITSQELRAVSSTMHSQAETMKLSGSRAELLLRMQDELGEKVASLEEELRNRKSRLIRASARYDGSLKRDAMKAFGDFRVSAVGIKPEHSAFSTDSNQPNQYLRGNQAIDSFANSASPTLCTAPHGRRMKPTLIEEAMDVYQGATLPHSKRHEIKSKDLRTKSRVTFAPEGEKLEKTTSSIAKNDKSQSANDEKSRFALLRHKLCLNGVIIALFLLLVFTSCCLIYYISLTVSSNAGARNVTSEVELDDDCVKKDDVILYSQLYSMMDLSADPCEDFYQYACGGWISSNYFPPGKKQYGIRAFMMEQNDRALLEVLGRDEKKSASLSTAEKKAKDFFKSCMDLATIDVLGETPLLDLIISLGGWESLGSWNSSSWNLNSSIYICQGKLSISVFFSINISPNLYPPHNNILVINPIGALSFDEANFYRDSTSRVYEKKIKGAMRAMLLLLGMQNVDDVVNDVFQFEKRLAMALFNNSLSQRNAFLPRVISIKELTSLCPQIGWQNIFAKIFKSTSISPDTEIIVKGPTRFFSDLSMIISESTARTLHNYVMWRVVFSRADRLSLEFRRATSSFGYELLRIDSFKPRWDECLAYVKDQFGEALQVLLARERSTMRIETKIEKMADQIKETYIQYVKQLDWLDLATRDEINKKLNATRFRIGVDRRFLENPRLLDKLYEFPVHPQRFFINFLKSVENKAEKISQTLAKVSNWSIRKKAFNVAGGYYAYEKQEVVLPLSYLQTPIYDPKLPDASLFGSVGSAIGHELTHAFDYLVGRRALSQTVSELINEKKNCFIQKFEQYTKSRNLAKATRLENMADTSGVRVAHTAYQNNARLQRRYHPDFNNDQLFFISFAQSWCAKRADNVAIVGRHAPEKYRVLGSLSEYEKFSESFSCRNGSIMNPAERCWTW